MRLKINVSDDEFNEAYLPLLDCESRYLVMYGGAGSGKSVFAAQRFILRLMENGMHNLLVVRAVGNTNRDSTFALFRQVISKWGLADYFKLNFSDMRIECLLTSNSVVFKGLDDSEKLKSITFPKGELTDIWIEEASEVCESDFNQLDLRLRGSGTNKQITVTFNPVDVNHWLKRRFFDNRPKNATVVKTTYLDNRFLEADYIDLLKSYKKTDEYYYNVYCLGQWGVFGKSVFSTAGVNERLQLGIKPVKTGVFEYTEVPVGLSDIRFTDDADGFLKIYCMPLQGVPYVIGADTAGDGSDCFVAQVLDNTSGKQVAVLRQQSDEDMFAKQLYCLGCFYNTALIGIETNLSTFPVRELERLGYSNQFVRQSEDEYTHRTLQSYGFRTTAVTRPVIIANLVSSFRSDFSIVSDETTLHEMQTFVRNAHGRPEAMAGAHDDCVMALAIAHYIRSQQGASVRTEAKKRVLWEEDMIEDYLNADDSDRKTMAEIWGGIPSNT